MGAATPSSARPGAAYRTGAAGGDGGASADAAGGDGAAVGDLLELLPQHCDPTVNLHDFFVCHRGGVVEEVLPITGRGPGL